MFRTPMTLDRANRNLTLFVVLFAVAIVAGASLLSNRPLRLPVAAIAVTLALAWAMAPRALVVDGDELRIVRRMWPPLRIARADIERAAPIDHVGKRVARLFGVGGYFGSYGLFWSDKLGRFRLYGTRRGQAVIIVRRGRLLPLITTPDDVAGAIGAIDTRPSA
jgi:hypothetical protein